MGDADVSQNIFTNDNTERLLDEALAEIDEEMDRLFSFINLLHIRLSYVKLEMESWEKIRHCLTAFNLFVIPVVLAIGIVYITAGMANSIQHGLETLIMILMYVAMVIGLPLYASSLWDMCFNEAEEEDFFLNSKSEYDDSVNATKLTLDDVQESLQNIGQFRTLSRAIYRRRSHINTRSAQEDRSNEEEPERENSLSESSDGSDGFKVETPAAYNNKKVRSAIQRIIDLDFDDSNVDTGPMSYNELREFHVLKYITGKSQEDLLSMNDDVVETRGVVKKPSKQETAGKTRSRKSLRNVTIKNIREGNSVAYKKDTCYKTMISPCLDTAFGL